MACLIVLQRIFKKENALQNDFSYHSLMHCWNCGKVLEDPLLNKLSFRATCDHCQAWLHSCLNCKYHRPHLSNQCLIPGTEPISDRSANNFCEEFLVLGKASEKKDDKVKKRFDDLFNN
jgi:hypothetical protein